MEPNNYQVTERLADGSALTIRAIRPEDRQRFAQAFEEFAKSPDSVHFRFHGFKRSLSQDEGIRMTQVDFVDHVALVATLGDHPESPLIGVGRYIVCSAPQRHRAEVPFSVLDQHQGKGIGSLLLRHLASIATEQGLRELEAEVLADNHSMLGVLERSGFPIQHSTDFGVTRVLLTIAGQQLPKEHSSHG